MNTQKLGKQAVVLGGSIAGLSAARVLSPYFERVVVIERDEQPTHTGPRKAVPQGYHAHALLKAGENVMEELFPGVMKDIERAGGMRLDFSKDVRWFHGGYWKMRYESGFQIAVQSRPLLEQKIRTRVEALGNVAFYYGYEVEAPLTSADNSRIIGVTAQLMADRSQKLEIDSDLLIDASGRGSKTPQWLATLGYAAPAETRLKINLTYSTRVYQAPENANYDFKAMIINPQAPAIRRAGYIFPMEGNKYMVTLAGYSGDTTPRDNESFVEFTRTLARPEVYETLKSMTPLTDVKVFNVPHTARRHYEKLSRIPAGLLVMGDAMCAFDPVFGQGMSAAALEALALGKMLAKETAQSFPTLGKRFQKKAAQIVEVPWMLASSEDFRFPQTEGYKSPIIPVLHWYTNHIFALSATDKEIFDAFRQAMHLLAGPQVLFKPTIVFKVLKHAFSRPARPAAVAQPELRAAT